jgi:hypothetical protein
MNQRSSRRSGSPGDGAVALLSLLLVSCLAGSTTLAATPTTPTTPATLTAREASFDYLYIESNEGGSSGGHTAIRFGSDVYHFQNEAGLLVLRRERAEDFLYTYALLGNRTIHSTRIAVSTESLTRLIDRFRVRHRTQEAQIRVADALDRDRAMLESLRDREEDPSEQPENLLLPVPGFGYFDSHPSAAGERSTPLVALQREIARVKGSDYLANRRRDLTDEMRALSERDPTDWAAESPASVYDHPPFARAYSSRWTDLAAGLAALDTLEAAYPLKVTTYHAPLDDSFVLGPEEIAALSRYAMELADQLVGLAGSRRPDWGQAFLVGMARLSALNRSIESRRLVFLDSFPEDSPALGHASIDRRGDISLMMLSENRKQFEASRAYFRKTTAPDELSWERLEERSNRYFEMLRALRGDLSIRVARGHLVPSRTAPYPIPVWPQRSGERLSEDLAHVKVRERSYSNAMQRLHRYQLVTQNCATAIFETLNDSFEDSVEISEQQLGGYVGSRYSLAFIPFVSALEVNDRYRVIQRETILSYRQLRLQTMKHEESTVRVALRESNTFTSTTYRRNSNDSFFVFFTEDAPLLRPLFGAVNLTAALGESILGILVAPVDRGAILIRGLRGTFVSLPELVFGNIRKGSNDWIPKQHRSFDPVIVKAE